MERIISKTRRTEKQILYNIYESLVEANLKLYIFTQFVTFIEYIGKESKIGKLCISLFCLLSQFLDRYFQELIRDLLIFLS